MKINRESRQQAKKLFRACLQNGQLNHAGIRQVVSELATIKPRNYAAILARIQKLVEIYVQERTHRVTTATPQADQGAAIFADLKKQFGTPEDAIYRVEPGLIGGSVIQAGSQVWDGSVKGRLQRLDQALSI